MFGTVGNVADDDEASTIVKRLLDEVPPGSYLALNDGRTLAIASAALSGRVNPTE